MKIGTFAKRLLLLAFVFFLLSIPLFYFVYNIHNNHLRKDIWKFSNGLFKEHPASKAQVLCVMSPDRKDFFLFHDPGRGPYENSVERIVNGQQSLLSVDFDAFFRKRYEKSQISKKGMCIICRVASWMTTESVSAGYHKIKRFMRKIEESVDVGIFFFVDDFGVVIRAVADGREVQRCVVKIGTYKGNTMALRTCFYVFKACIGI